MLYEALTKKYEAEISESLATLQIYMNKSVGIGEHSDLLTELDKYVSKLSAAEDNLKTLQRHKVTLSNITSVTESAENLTGGARNS